MVAAQDGISLSFFNILTLRISEGAWQASLNHAANHPFQFAVIVLFAMFFLFSIFKGRKEIKRIRNAQIEKFIKLFRPDEENASQEEENRN